jgi:hypothetical protein
MKSNVCKIENGTRDLETILKESQKVADYNELNHKQAMQLRLLCEEIDGMLPRIIDEFDGDFWIEFEDGVCKINVSVKFKEFTTEKKEALISIAKNKRNAAAAGIIGKLRSEIENAFLGGEALKDSVMMANTAYMQAGYNASMDFSYFWSLEKYRSTVTVEEVEAWDELEKSVIASLADDVIVGIKGRRTDIVVIKKFA